MTFHHSEPQFGLLSNGWIYVFTVCSSSNIQEICCHKLCRGCSPNLCISLPILHLYSSNGICLRSLPCNLFLKVLSWLKVQACLNLFILLHSNKEYQCFLGHCYNELLKIPISMRYFWMQTFYFKTKWLFKQCMLFTGKTNQKSNQG